MRNGDPLRREGPTFALPDVGFIDFETRGPASLKEAGAYRYATEADAIVLAWAIGGRPVETVTVPSFARPLDLSDLPTEILAHHARVMSGKAIWAAWNAGFDKAIWNYSTLAFPEMRPHDIIDVMAQAAASGLPPDLAMAARFVGAEQKLASGADLIKLFCLPDSKATPATHPVEWAAFLEYAAGDIAAMRSVFLNTRQLPLAEWIEYWAMEAINERGAVIDLPMVSHAAKLAAEDKVRSRAELSALTAGKVTTVDQVKRITGWLLERLPPEGRDILTQRAEELDEETGEVTTPAKHALTRRRVERLIAYVDDLGWPDMDDALRVLEIRLYGGSKTPAKFAKMLGQQIDGRLYGQYVFNGAGQTGRASSRGVQIHNLARDVLDDEHDAIEQVLAGCSYDDMLSARPTPVARQLSLLIRPAFVPSCPENVFVWSDWSQIEARVLPWLADHHAGARARIQIFRDVDLNPRLPDLYTRTAAVLSHVPIEQVTKPMRQRGKVAELALGFCGGVGALLAMAAGYGLHLSEAEARSTVDAWRLANPWVRDYSRELWEAMHSAMGLPGVTIKAGRVKFTFLPSYLNGSLLVTLPSGRCLTYRALHWENVDVMDDEGQPTGEKKLEMTFARNYGRIKLWPGMFMENFTQATAADVLRGTLVRLKDIGAVVRLHTHDEVLVECSEADAEIIEDLLSDVMQRGFGWSRGLPIMSEETIAPYYTKAEG